MSMKPGATAQPEASSSRLPRRFGLISWITPPAIATSAARPGAPLPSKTVPPRMTSSAGIGILRSRLRANLMQDERDDRRTRALDRHRHSAGCGAGPRRADDSRVSAGGHDSFRRARGVGMPLGGGYP